jgi:pyrroloquinoline quinone (PQQ) biosynthesis protein C
LGRESEQAAKRLVDEIYDDDSRIEGEPLRQMLRSFMWNEFYFGTYPPAKQMHRVYELNDRDVSQDIDIVIELANMARDELKHAKLFSNRIEELGGNPDIREYEPTEEQLELFHRVYDRDDIVALAAGQQMGTERFVPVIFQALIDYDVVDDRTKEVLHSADLDEPNHHNVGRKIVLRFGDDEERREKAIQANQEAIEAMYRIYGLEYEPERI